MPGTFLIDTGSAITLISWEYYNRLPESTRPPLKETVMVAHGVTGAGLTVHGRTMLIVHINGRRLPYEFHVVEMSQDVILGIDFLDDYR